MKTTKKRTEFHTIVLIVGIIFLIVGVFYQIPDREIPWDYEEYVGGDAYNIMIEASIRGGEIAGATVTKAIYTVFGFSLLLLSTFLRMRSQANSIPAPNERKNENNTTENDTDFSNSTY